ncbi:hypothetical protein [Pseudonocardia zijingensis]|uniref:hypothetical protein n=1 Tax=Pseudonocardia zijingensis TaxID=153376 RepID=UPI00360769E4
MTDDELAASPVVAWARDLLAASGPGPSAAIVLGLDRDLHPEGFRLRRAHDGAVTISAGGPVGAAYAVSDIADRIRTAPDPSAALDALDDVDEEPAVPVRGILRSFSSDRLDQDWFRDEAFWTEYLDELATQRINWFQLALGMQYNYSHEIDIRDNYLCFAYPFLVDVPDWNVTVEGLSAEEREANLRALRFASDEAARRGIHFQLGLWMHAAEPDIVPSPHLRYPIHGLTGDDVAAYSAQALSTVLAACPSIAGVTFRVHYEGGVAEDIRGSFWRTVMEGLRDVGRPILIDMHAKGVDAELQEIAAGTGQAVMLSAKYAAEHQGLPYHQTTIRDLERARPSDDDLRQVTQGARRFTRYGYGDFLPADREHDLLFRIWPGTQRLLLWADPVLFAGYARESTIAGALGVELCEPLTFRGRKDTAGNGPRDLYADPELAMGTADWKKYRYEYRLWGRLLYDPDASPETWRRWLRSMFADDAAHVEEAVGTAGRILPLMTVAFDIAADNQSYWPEVFLDIPLLGIADEDWASSEVPAPHAWGSVSPLDPAMFDTTDEYIAGLLAGCATGKHTPIDVAGWFDELAATAAAALDRIAVTGDALETRRVTIDVKVLIQLARFFAAKLRAGVDHGIAMRTDDPRRRSSAARHAASASDAYERILEIVDGVYADDLGFGLRRPQYGHWRDRVPAIDADARGLAELAAAAPRSASSAAAPAPEPAATPAAPSIVVDVASVLRPGHELPVRIEGAESGAHITLHYRHLNQGEDFVETPMTEGPGGFTATIPADYTRSPYPLVLFATVRAADGGAAWVMPGLRGSLADRPYVLVDHPDATGRWSPHR